MDFKTKQKHYNACDPNESLPPGDYRNVDFDSLDQGSGLVRGVNWVERMATKIELAPKKDHVSCLFTGLPGSGKTTELKRLEKRLQSRDRAKLLTVFIDATEVIDTANPIEISDIVSSLIFRTEEEIIIKEGGDPKTILEKGSRARLWTWLKETNVNLKEIKIGGAGANLIFELKANQGLRSKVNETIQGHILQYIQKAREEFSFLNERARKLGHDGICIIFDSLEKLRGMHSNWEQVLASAERIFSGGAPYLKFPVHAIYTVPPALFARQADAIEFMPVIKIHDRNNVPYKPGIDAMRELIRRRLPDHILNELFGVEFEAKAAKLIEWSGGYTRDLLRMLHGAFLEKQFPLPDSPFLRLRNEIWDAYHRLIFTSEYEWLARVAHKRKLVIEDDKHIQTAERLLLNNAVLRYLNDEDWFDLHPGVLNISGVQEAFQRLKQPRNNSQGD